MAQWSYSTCCTRCHAPATPSQPAHAIFTLYPAIFIAFHHSIIELALSLSNKASTNKMVPSSKRLEQVLGFLM
jgi:hypothetical protein